MTEDEMKQGVKDIIERAEKPIESFLEFASSIETKRDEIMAYLKEHDPLVEYQVQCRVETDEEVDDSQADLDDIGVLWQIRKVIHDENKTESPSEIS